MRVVGGRLRSRPIAGPKGDGLRPTADRLREALFNILMHAYGVRHDHRNRPDRIGVRHCHVRDGRESGGTRGEMQKLSAAKFHSITLSARTIATLSCLTRQICEFDHCRPLRDLIGDELAARLADCFDTKRKQPRLEIRIGDAGHDCRGPLA